MSAGKTPVEQGYLKADDGVRLFFHRIGTGPAIVFPNGIYLIEDFERFATGRTLIFYDVRNRGRSDCGTDPAMLANGILQDVGDLEAVRRQLGIASLDLVAHSYMGMMVNLYAMKYPMHVNRIVEIGPVQPNASTQYPAHLTGADAVLTDVFSNIGRLRQQSLESGAAADPEVACKQFWSVLKPLYVLDPVNVSRIKWDRCNLVNERNFMGYFTGTILPSMQRLRFSARELAHVTAPVLIIHGRRDRNAPYGGGREWAMLFPNARLLTIENAAHAPWIEAPEEVFGTIEEFLNGAWPSAAETIEVLDPDLSRATCSPPGT